MACYYAQPSTEFSVLVAGFDCDQYVHNAMAVPHFAKIRFENSSIHKKHSLSRHDYDVIGRKTSEARHCLCVVCVSVLSVCSNIYLIFGSDCYAQPSTVCVCVRVLLSLPARIVAVIYGFCRCLLCFYPMLVYNRTASKGTLRG